MPPALTLRPLAPTDEAALADLFVANDAPEVTRWFDPFPLTADTARHLTHLEGRDLYWGAWEEGELVGLAMVRGWDGGHPEPAFGLLVDRHRHGGGRGTMLTALVLAELAQRGVPEVRSRVHDDNLASLGMLRRNGYEELSREGGRVVVRARPAVPE